MRTNPTAPTVSMTTIMRIAAPGRRSTATPVPRRTAMVAMLPIARTTPATASEMPVSTR